MNYHNFFHELNVLYYQSRSTSAPDEVFVYKVLYIHFESVSYTHKKLIPYTIHNSCNTCECVC